MVVDYEKVSVIIFVKNEHDLKMYFNLFRVLLSDNATTTTRSRDYGKIETEKFNIRFYIKQGYSQRGCRAHYILNLTQDEEFEKCVAPARNIRSLLDCEKWIELFK